MTLSPEARRRAVALADQYEAQAVGIEKGIANGNRFGSIQDASNARRNAETIRSLLSAYDEALLALAEAEEREQVLLGIVADLAKVDFAAYPAHGSGFVTIVIEYDGRDNGTDTLPVRARQAAEAAGAWKP